MPTLKRKNANGQWEYIQVSGLDVSQLKDEVDSVMTSLAESATKTDGFISVTKYGAVGDAHYRTTSNNYFSDVANTIPAKTTGNSTAFNQAFTDALSQNKNLLIPYGDFFIDAPVTWDFNSGKVNIVCMGRLKAKTSIGTMITIKNPRDSKINLDLYDGGIDGDTGILVQGGKFNTFGIRGDYFAGTLWKVIGDKTSNFLASNTVDYLLANFCGQAIVHGDGINLIDGFGAYKTIWDNGSKHGSIFQLANDITILHYENWLKNLTEDGTIFRNNGAVHIGTLAVGGVATNIVTIDGASVFSIQTLYMLGEDNAQNGVQTKTTDGLNIINNSMVSIDNLYPTRIRNAIKYTTGCTVTIKTLYANTVDAVVLQDGSSLGRTAGVPDSFYNYRPQNNYGVVTVSKYTTALSTLSATASPYSYTNNSNNPVQLFIQGGAVTKIEFTRNGTAFYDTGQTQGIIQLAPFDRVKITYTTAPTIVLCPL